MEEEREGELSRSDGTKEDSAVSHAHDLRIVTFTLGKKAYGIDITKVKEISSAHRFTYVPNTKPFVRGVFNLRGDIIPVLDLRIFFNLELSQENRLDSSRNNSRSENLIILTFDYINIGVIVDSISHVIGVPKESIRQNHLLLNDLDIQYIDGVVEYQSQLYVILAMNRIIDPRLELNDVKGFDFEATFLKMSKPFARKSRPKALGDGAEEREFSEKGLAPPAAPDGESDERDAAVVEEETVEEEIEEIEEKTEGGTVYQVADPFFQSLVDNLSLEGFYVSPVNVRQLETLWYEWCSRKHVSVSLVGLFDSEHNRRDFLNSYFSKQRYDYWNEEMLLTLQDLFSEGMEGLNVLHLGCGSGKETYSIAAGLSRKFPDCPIHISASDSDLLKVSEAPSLHEEDLENIPDYLREYVHEAADGGGFYFSDVLKSKIIFEYQEVLYAAPYTEPDLVIMRDLLPFYERDKQKRILGIVWTWLKEDGYCIIGDYEELGEEDWECVKSDVLKIYKKKQALNR